MTDDEITGSELSFPPGAAVYYQAPADDDDEELHFIPSTVLAERLGNRYLIQFDPEGPEQPIPPGVSLQVDVRTVG